MNRRGNNFSPGWLVFGFIALMVALQYATPLALLMLFGMGVWLYRRYVDDGENVISRASEEVRRELSNPRSSSSGTRRGGRRAPFYEDVLPQQRPAASPARPSESSVQSHAIQAVRAAGQDPAMLPVLPVDIGVLAYRGDDDPVIHRDWAVMDDVDYVQPFVQLRLPRTATGRVRFELIDSDGERQFIHEQDYQLERGRNLVVPAVRLPIHDNYAMEGKWHLRVSADDVLLAVHDFEWDDSSQVTPALRHHILEDGEISNELRAALAENKLERMSLDDLLAEQDDNDDINGAESQDGPRRVSRRT